MRVCTELKNKCFILFKSLIPTVRIFYFCFCCAKTPIEFFIKTYFIERIVVMYFYELIDKKAFVRLDSTLTYKGSLCWLFS